MIHRHLSLLSDHAIVRKYRPVVILFVLVILGSVSIGGSSYWLDNSVMAAIYALMALSVGISYGQAGVLSVATATFSAIGAYGTAIFATRYGFSPVIGFLFSIFAPMLLGYILARVIGRLSPLPLAIATLMLADLATIGFREGGDYTGGFIGISGIPRLGFASSPEAFSYLAWAIVLVVVYLYVGLMKSSIGRAINTARYDALRARADGVNVSHVISMAFALSSSVAGVAGWLYAHYVTYIGPDSFSLTLSLDVILMAVIGGTRTFLGPVCGAVIFLLIGIYMPAAGSRGMIFGAIMVLILLVAPRGLLGGRLLRARKVVSDESCGTISSSVTHRVEE